MEVDVPVSVAYNFYLDRESFPKWMPFISSVEVDLIFWSISQSFNLWKLLALDFNSVCVLLLGVKGQAWSITLVTQIQCFWSRH